MSTGPTVKVSTQPPCDPCEQVTWLLVERDVEFATCDVVGDPIRLNALTVHGFMATPVTRLGQSWIAGLNRRELEVAHAETFDLLGAATR